MAGTLKESVLLTIQKRASKIRRASFEIVNIVKDYRAQRVGGFMTGLVLWESCAIPSLLYNCSTWVDMGKEALKVLNDLQDSFLRLLWGTGPGAPKVAGGGRLPFFIDAFIYLFFHIFIAWFVHSVIHSLFPFHHDKQILPKEYDIIMPYLSWLHILKEAGRD